MHKERKAAVRWLTENGWTVDDVTHQATHPLAARALRVGGPHGWPLKSIKREAAHALGKRGDRTNRAAAVKAAEAAHREALEAERAEAIRRRDAQIVDMIRRDADLALVAHARDALAGIRWTFTPHALERMNDHGLERADVVDAVTDPIDVHLDRRSVRIVGRRAAAVVDLARGVVITAHPPAPLPVRDRRPLVAEAR